MHNKKIHIKFGSKIHKVLFDNAMGAGVGTSAVAQNDYGISVRILCPQMLIPYPFYIVADKFGIRLLVVHYPPYCSKFNPIEHRLFSQITRSWSGAPLMSLQNAADRAARTTTKKGLKVHVHINSKTYDIKRPIDESYQKRLARQVVFAQELGKWNYLVKPVN